MSFRDYLDNELPSILKDLRAEAEYAPSFSRDFTSEQEEYERRVAHCVSHTLRLTDSLLSSPYKLAWRVYTLAMALKIREEAVYTELQDELIPEDILALFEVRHRQIPSQLTRRAAWALVAPRNHEGSIPIWF